jgi:hypothetical protein
MRKPAACAFLDLRELFFRRRGLGSGCAFYAGENRVVAAGTREHDGEGDRGDHEDDGGPGGELGEEVGCSARAEGCLRTLTAEGSGEVGGFALLEEDDANDEERNDNVQGHEKSEHCGAGNLLDPENIGIGVEEGTKALNVLLTGTPSLALSVSPGIVEVARRSGALSEDQRVDRAMINDWSSE